MLQGDIFMRKVFELEDLDCANCAAKIEEAISHLDGVKYASVSFMTQRMVLDIEDEKYDQVLESVKKTIKKIEPDCSIKR